MVRAPDLKSGGQKLKFCSEPLKTISLNPLHPKSALIDFTLSNARRFYFSKGRPP